MAERTCLLNKRTLNGVPGVRIPVSPRTKNAHQMVGIFGLKSLIFRVICKNDQCMVGKSRLNTSLVHLYSQPS